MDAFFKSSKIVKLYGEPTKFLMIEDFQYNIHAGPKDGLLDGAALCMHNHNCSSFSCCHGK